MSTRYPLWLTLIACTAGLVLQPPAWSQDSQNADARELASYRLTEAALTKYAAATRALAPVLAENPPGCDDTSDESLTAMAARLDAIPGAPAAVRGAGLSTRDYIVFGIAMFQAGMASWAVTDGGGELPAGVSPKNVEFYEAHQVEIQELSGLLPENDCDGGDDYGEGDGEAEGLEEWDQEEASESDG